MKCEETVSGKARYREGKLECIDIIEELGEILSSRNISQKKIYNLQQVVRYIWRLGAKDNVDIELGKALNYLWRAKNCEWLEK